MQIIDANGQKATAIADPYQSELFHSVDFQGPSDRQLNTTEGRMPLDAAYRLYDFRAEMQQGLSSTDDRWGFRNGTAIADGKLQGLRFRRDGTKESVFGNNVMGVGMNPITRDPESDRMLVHARIMQTGYVANGVPQWIANIYITTWGDEWARWAVRCVATHFEIAGTYSWIDIKGTRYGV